MADCGEERAEDGMDRVKCLIETMVIVAHELEEGVTGGPSGEFEWSKD